MYTTTVKGVDCYGELCDDSNFHIVCEDEDFDGVWVDGNPETLNGNFQSWEDVVDILQKHIKSPIIEITAV